MADTTVLASSFVRGDNLLFTKVKMQSVAGRDLKHPVKEDGVGTSAPPGQSRSIRLLLGNGRRGVPLSVARTCQMYAFASEDPETKCVASGLKQARV